MKITKIKCSGMTAPFTGNFYHIVEFYNEKKLIASKKVYGCENRNEAISYAIQLLDLKIDE